MHAIKKLYFFLSNCFLSIFNTTGDEKTNGPPSPGINRPETDSKPNCNLSHKLGVQQQHQENEKKPGLQQPPGDNNGYNRSHFAEPDRGQVNGKF